MGKTIFYIGAASPLVAAIRYVDTNIPPSQLMFAIYMMAVGIGVELFSKKSGGRDGQA